MAARLQWDCEYATRLWQACGIDNVAARLLVNILQGCGKVVTNLWNRQCGCKVAVGL